MTVETHDHIAPRPTMRAVAALAGVGIKTVSRVINGEPHVTADKVERVHRAVEMLGYRTHEQASSLRRAGGRTHTLALLLGNVANPFSGAIHRAVEDIALDRGTAVFASSLDDEPSRERSLVEAFLRRRVDGLILTTVAESQSYLIPEVARGIPIVFVDREPVGIVADVVVSDNLGGSRMATAHLLSYGHRRIAYLGDNPRIRTAQLRRKGFELEMAAAGIALEGLAVREDLRSEDAAEAAVLELLSAPHPPSALYSAQNLVSIGTLHALKRLGLMGRVALVGFDDLPLADLLEPGLTVVAQDAAAIGHVAATRVFARLDGDKQSPTTTLVPTRLLTRGSGELVANA